MTDTAETKAPFHLRGIVGAIFAVSELDFARNLVAVKVVGAN
jgi:hypothetical protein